jgi:hypothetical protein
MSAAVSPISPHDPHRHHASIASNRRTWIAGRKPVMLLESSVERQDQVSAGAAQLALARSATASADASPKISARSFARPDTRQPLSNAPQTRNHHIALAAQPLSGVARLRARASRTPTR